MNGQQIVYDFLDSNNISYEYIEHPAAPTIDIAKQYVGVKKYLKYIQL